jgi:hypothetical protein
MSWAFLKENGEWFFELIIKEKDLKTTELYFKIPFYNGAYFPSDMHKYSLEGFSNNNKKTTFGIHQIILKNGYINIANMSMNDNDIDSPFIYFKLPKESHDKLLEYILSIYPNANRNTGEDQYGSDERVNVLTEYRFDYYQKVLERREAGTISVKKGLPPYFGEKIGKFLGGKRTRKSKKSKKSKKGTRRH